MWKPLVTAANEGGYYSPFRDEAAPIRIYPDRTVYDEIYGGWRGRLSRQEFRRARRVAKANLLSGRVRPENAT